MFHTRVEACDFSFWLGGVSIFCEEQGGEIGADPTPAHVLVYFALKFVMWIYILRHYNGTSRNIGARVGLGVVAIPLYTAG
jgi:hypothetical protein